MALIFLDGFDHYATADLTKKWTSLGTYSPTISSTLGRRSGGALVGNTSSTTSEVKKAITAISTVIVGVAYKPNSSADVIRLYEGATQHITLYFSSGTFKLYRGTNTGTLLATGTTSVTLGTWVYLELKVTINDTTGAYEFRLNGVSEFSATNVDTRNGGTSDVVDTVSLGGYNGYFDDLYICSTSGSANNDFLGDCRIDTIMPTGDGNYSQFTPSTGTAHWSLVDEKPTNTTDYVSDATSGDRDSYTFPDLSGLSSQTVYGVQINAYSQKSDAGARSLGTMARLSGTDSDGASVALPTSWSFISQIYETDPASAAWTESNVNAAEFGVKVTA